MAGFDEEIAAFEAWARTRQFVKVDDVFPDHSVTMTGEPAAGEEGGAARYACSTELIALLASHYETSHRDPHFVAQAATQRAAQQRIAIKRQRHQARRMMGDW